MNIVLVGAGGTGISSLGFLLKDLGYANIIGIDSSKSQITHELEKHGIVIQIGHGEYKVQAGDVVIYSDACPNAPEVLAAKALVEERKKGAQLPYSYFSFLGEISKYFETIAVAGTHGKSTTTALMTYILSKVDPQFGLGILGALVPQLGQKNYWANPNITPDLQSIFTYILTGKSSEWDESLRKKYRFVIEADEFNRHFLLLDVDHAIILNAELDHSDIYPDETVYLEAFIAFVHKVKHGTYAIHDEKGIEYIQRHSKKEFYMIKKQNIDLGYIFGEHNEKNATLIHHLLQHLGIGSKDSIMQALHSFKGLRRRMELLKAFPSGALLYTDYGHHPTEIHAVYEAMRAKYPHKRLIAVFQPHQARRVLEFRDDFAKTISQFDISLIYNIYAARENLPDLLATFPRKDHTHIHDIDSLGTTFAQACNSRYTIYLTDVIHLISREKKDDVICLFTAGNLDFQIRGWLEENEIS